MKKLILSIIVLLGLGLTLTETHFFDKAPSLYDKLLGRVSLVCTTYKRADTKLSGLSSDSVYNVVIRVRAPQRILAIERHAGNFNYDISKKFSSLEVSDHYLTLGSIDSVMQSVEINRYTGQLNYGLFNEIGYCRQGYLDSDKKF